MLCSGVDHAGYVVGRMRKVRNVYVRTSLTGDEKKPENHASNHEANSAFSRARAGECISYRSLEAHT